MRILPLVALLLCSCDKYPFRSESPPRAAEPITTDRALVIGNGQILKAPGVSVLVGPTTITQGVASIPFYVQEAPPFINAKYPAISCLLFDDQHRLAESSGGMLPPRLHGGSIDLKVHRDLTNGSVQCQLGTVDRNGQ